MKILGHRGTILPSGKPYQNSLAALKLAVERAEGFETDACISMDGEIFFIHEAKYLGDHVEYCLEEHLNDESRKITAGRKLEEMSSAEIKKLKLLDGSAIPSFEELLPLFKDNDKIFNIELKSSQAAQHVVKRVKAALENSQIKANQVLISSFNHPSLIYVRKELPNIPLGMIFLPEDFKPAVLFPWTDNTESRYEPLTRTYLDSDVFEQIKPEFIIIPDNIATEQTCRMIREAQPDTKLVVWVFTELGSYDPEAFHSMCTRESKDGFLSALLIDKLP